MAFEDLSVDWFREHGAVEPDESHASWVQWVSKRERKDAAKHQKCLELVTGLSPGAVQHYRQRRFSRLANSTLAKLDTITNVLGIRVENRENRRTVRRGEMTVALFTELDVPSITYHMELLRGIIRAADHFNVEIALHEATQSTLARAIQSTRLLYRPDAAIAIRLTPTREVIEVLLHADLPMILIHASRLQYPWPVIANVVPDQTRLEQQLEIWVRGLKRRKRSGKSKIVMASMPKESLLDEFPPIEGVATSSIRNDRIERICRALGKKMLVPDYEVGDYSFRHALQFVNKVGEADGYVCLSDQLATGVKHVLLSNGGENEDATQRIVGFDDSELAKAENITSFGHSLADIGNVVFRYLLDHVNDSGDELGGSVELPVKMELKIRG